LPPGAGDEVGIVGIETKPICQLESGCQLDFDKADRDLGVRTEGGLDLGELQTAALEERRERVPDFPVDRAGGEQLRVLGAGDELVTRRLAGEDGDEDRGIHHEFQDGSQVAVQLYSLRRGAEESRGSRS